MSGHFILGCGKPPTVGILAATLLAAAVPPSASGRTVRQSLVATGADADAAGKATLQVKKKKSMLTGRLTVQAKKLEPGLFEVSIDGVRVGTLAANARGKGKARFRTNPRSANDQLLGVDPRGRSLVLVSGTGVPVLLGRMSDDSPDDDVRCCLPDDSGPECEDRTAAECATLAGINLGAGSCTPNPCFPGGSTSTTLPATPIARVVCEKRTDRSRASVDGNNLASGTYSARLASGTNVATSSLVPTVGDEVEFDFDSDPADIAAGATAIGAAFIQGNPPQVTGEILDGALNVVASATGRGC